MKRAIFFDLDGTLWDALEPIKDSWNNTMEKHEFKYRFSLKTITSMMGLTPDETLPIAFPGLKQEEARKLFLLCLKDQLVYLKSHPGKLYPDEIDVLNRLVTEYPLYIVSNADKGYIEDYLEAYKLQHLFKGHLCAGDTGKDKGTNIRVMMEKAGVDEVIYVGDTQKDFDAALKARVKFIHANYGFGKIDRKVTELNILKELPSYIEKLFKEE